MFNNRKIKNKSDLIRIITNVKKNDVSKFLQIFKMKIIFIHMWGFKIENKFVILGMIIIRYL